VPQAWYAKPQTQLRTRYEHVLATISASGDARGDVHLGLFEEMFTPREIGRLSDFLGIPANPSFGDRGVFVNPSRSSPPTALAREVAAFYRETYAAVGRHLPRARAAWPGFGLLRGDADRGSEPGARRRAA